MSFAEHTEGIIAEQDDAQFLLNLSNNNPEIYQDFLDLCED